MVDLQKLYDAILNGDAKAAASVTQEALAEGVPPLDLVTKHMVPAMDEVGRRFEANEYFVPELLISARAMKRALDLIRPLLTARGDKPVGTVAIAVVVRNQASVRTLNFVGGREQVKYQSAQAAMNMLRLMLLAGGR